MSSYEGMVNPVDCMLAKHFCDWSFRRGGRPEVVPLSTIRRQGYSQESFGAWLLLECDTCDPEQGIYRGEPEWPWEVRIVTG